VVELGRFRGGFRDLDPAFWIRLLPMDFMFCSDNHLEQAATHIIYNGDKTKTDLNRTSEYEND